MILFPDSLVSSFPFTKELSGKDLKSDVNRSNIDSNFFDETMNELTSIFENFNDSLYELEDIDIENVLDRIEKLSSLQKRFGSIKEALEYKEQKKIELDSYENISFEKSILEKKLKKINDEINILSKELTIYRKESALILEKKINTYLKSLYLSNARLPCSS